MASPRPSPRPGSSRPRPESSAPRGRAACRRRDAFTARTNPARPRPPSPSPAVPAAAAVVPVPAARAAATAARAASKEKASASASSEKAWRRMEASEAAASSPIVPKAAACSASEMSRGAETRPTARCSKLANARIITSARSSMITGPLPIARPSCSLSAGQARASGAHQIASTSAAAANRQPGTVRTSRRSGAHALGECASRSIAAPTAITTGSGATPPRTKPAPRHASPAVTSADGAHRCSRSPRSCACVCACELSWSSSAEVKRALPATKGKAATNGSMPARSLVKTSTNCSMNRSIGRSR